MQESIFIMANLNHSSDQVNYEQLSLPAYTRNVIILQLSVRKLKGQASLHMSEAAGYESL
jgi:hypothetical protein